MTRQIAVTTPENVRIEYELAGVASRAGAAVVDTLIQGLMIGVVVAAQALLDLYGRWPGTSFADAVLYTTAFVIFWGYYVFFETVWSGRTPGKRALRLRTVREGGQPIDLSCAAIRNLVRAIDFLPPPYVAGAICILATSRNQRLGDLAAGTLVVKERGEWVGGPESAARAPAHSSAAASRIRNIELVTLEEFEAAKRFHERKAELGETVREEIAAKIARPLMTRLGIEDDGGVVYSELLSEIYTRCIVERGMR